MYQQGLNENPVYVPRKIRHDKYIVLTADELKILQRREINELKSEIELFKLREERNRKKVELQDDLVSIFVTEQVQNPYLKEAILRAWNEKNLKEMERVTDVWRGKVNGMIKAYEKDKEFIRRHNQNRIKEQNSNTSRQVLNPRGNLEDNSLLVRNENPEGVIQNNSGQFRNRNIVTAQENDSPLALEDTREAAEEEEISRQGEIEMISQIDTMPNRSPSSAPVIDVDIEDQGSNLNTILTAETIPSSQRAIHRSSIDLEEVESDENFSDAESSQILFENTQDIRDAQRLATLTDTSEDEADDEEIGGQQDFQSSYNLRKKRRKVRNSYSPQLQQQSTSQRRPQRQRSSTSQAIDSQQRR